MPRSIKFAVYLLGLLVSGRAGAQSITLPVLQDTLFVQTSPVTDGNSAAEVTITGAGSGSLALSPNFLLPGRTIKIAAFGYHSASGNPSIRIRVYFGTTVVLDTGTVTSGNSTNAIWDIRAQVTGITSGSTGTLQGEGFYTEAAGGVNLFGMVNTSTTTIDTTAAQTIKITAQWGTAAAGNTLTMTNLLIESTK